MAPNAPKIAARFSSGNETCMMASTCGNIASAARPWTTRAAMSRPAPGASPHSGEATTKANT
jgi:hypothetical protein